MKKLLIVLTLSMSLFTYGQQSKIDSLKSELINEQHDIKKIEIIGLILSKSYYVNFEVFESYCDSLCYYSKKLNNPKYKAQCYRYLGFKWLAKANYDKSLFNFNKAQSIFAKENDSVNIIKNNNNIAILYKRTSQIDSAEIIYKKNILLTENSENKKLKLSNHLANYNLGILLNEKGKTDKAIFYLNESLKKAKSINNDKYIASSLYMLGTIYKELNQLEKAKSLLKESLIIFEKNMEHQFIGAVHNNLANIFKKNDSLNKSVNHYELALYSIKKSKHFKSLPLIYNNLGNLNNSINQQVIGFKYLDSANFYSEKFKDTLELGRNYKFKANIYHRLNDFDNAIKFSKKAKLLFKKIGSKPELISVYKNLAVYHNKQKKYQQAYTYLSHYKSLNDSIYKIKSLKAISEIETKYQTEKKEKENLQLKAANAEQFLSLEKEKNNKWFLGTGLLSVSLLSLVFWRKYKSEEKAKRIITLQKDEIVEQKEVIETLQKDLHHRVKNNLAIINRFIDVVKEEFDNEAFDTKLIELQNRIASINEVHQQLYNNKDATKLGVKKYIDKLKLNIENTFVNENITVEQSIDDTVNLKADKSFPVGLIINEFLTNSFKYAFPDSEKGKISININESEDYYNLELIDNGKGFPKGFDATNSRTFGLRIMKLLTQQINGTFDIDGSNGVKLNVQFPK